MMLKVIFATVAIPLAAAVWAEAEARMAPPVTMHCTATQVDGPSNGWPADHVMSQGALKAKCDGLATVQNFKLHKGRTAHARILADKTVGARYDLTVHRGEIRDAVLLNSDFVAAKKGPNTLDRTLTAYVPAKPFRIGYACAHFELMALDENRPISKPFDAFYPDDCDVRQVVADARMQMGIEPQKQVIVASANIVEAPVAAKKARPASQPRQHVATPYEIALKKYEAERRHSVEQRRQNFWQAFLGN